MRMKYDMFKKYSGRGDAFKFLARDIKPPDGSQGCTTSSIEHASTAAAVLLRVFAAIHGPFTAAVTRGPEAPAGSKAI